MRFAAITRILNEADIVEAFVRHNAVYFSHHIFMDNGSTDGTLQILNQLADEGYSIEIYQNKTVSFNEIEMSTFLYHKAAENYRADWVYCLDADEFIDDRHLSGGLCTYLESLWHRSGGSDCVKIPWTQYMFTSMDDQSQNVVPLRLQRRLPVSKDYKVIVKGNLAKNNIQIDSGAHNILVDGRHFQDYLIQDDATLAHYSERSAYQHISKFVRGWARVLAAGSGLAEAGIAYHYKSPFDYMLTNPGALLRNDHFMNRRNDHVDAIVDPIDYKGGPLRYTNQNDEMMRAISGIVGYIEAVSRQHGRLIDAHTVSRDLVADWNRRSEKLR